MFSTAYLKCGDLHEGFARVRCPDCKLEMFVAFSCKQRCTCPSCHQKRALLTAMHVAEEVCSSVAHRQVVFTIPKRLRMHTRFDRKLLGKLSSCAWNCLRAEACRLLTPTSRGACARRRKWKHPPSHRARTLPSRHQPAVARRGRC